MTRTSLCLAVVVPLSFVLASPVLAQTAAPAPPSATSPALAAAPPTGAAPAAPAAPPPTTASPPASAAASVVAPPPAPTGPAPTSDQRALAETLFFTGRGLMEGQRYAQACQKFAESYRLDPAAGTLLNLAVCHQKEGKIASSWGEFHQALAEAKRANRPERIQLASEKIKELEPDLPFVTIVVPKEVRVPGLEIQRNGVALLEGAWETELPIDPGTNEITANAPLYKPEKKTVTLEKRQHVTVTIDPLVLAPVERPPPPYWTTKRTWGAGLFLGGVVAAGVGVGFGALTLSQKSASDNGCPLFDGQRRCSQAGADAMSSAKTDAVVADIGIGVGAAAALVGGFLFLTGGAKEEGAPAPAAPPPAAAWNFRVTSGAHGAQGFVTYSF